MKDSGISWIGEIPVHWEVKRLKQESTFINGFAFDSEDFKIEDGVRVIRIGDIGLKADFEHCVRAITNPQLLAPYKIKNGDILIAMSGATTGKCCIVDNAEEAYINQRVGIIRSDIRKIIYYSLQTQYFMEFVNLNNAGSAQPNISFKAIGEFSILSMPTTEQQRIAEFLDRKCAEVDEMIALQEHIIEELKAYKQSVITEAVTKGLNPAAPMRDSSIKWIGQIPEHWEVTKFYRICSVITDFVASGSFESLRINVPYLDYPDYAMLVRTVDLSGKGRTAEKVYISKHSYDFLSNSNLFGGEIILPNIGASVGDVYIVPNLYERMSLAPNSIMFKTKQCDRYWYYYFYSEAGKQSIFDICQSTAQPKFNKTELRDIRVCIPTKNEQQAIADYLDGKCADIDALIATKQQKIDSLKEYKKSIIYEYVTGKREVE